MRARVLWGVMLLKDDQHAEQGWVGVDTHGRQPHLCVGGALRGFVGRNAYPGRIGDRCPGGVGAQGSA